MTAIRQKTTVKPNGVIEVQSLDSSYLIALAVPADQHHGKAMDLFTEIRRQIKQALTADEHFQQSGLVALLRG